MDDHLLGFMTVGDICRLQSMLETEMLARHDAERRIVVLTKALANEITRRLRAENKIIYDKIAIAGVKR